MNKHITILQSQFSLSLSLSQCHKPLSSWITISKCISSGFILFIQFEKWLVWMVQWYNGTMVQNTQFSINEIYPGNIIHNVGRVSFDMNFDLDGCPKIDDKIPCWLHQNAYKLQNLSVQCAKCIWYALCIMCTSDRQMLCNNVLKIMVNNGDRNNSSWFLTRTAMQLSNWMLLYQMPQFNCEMFSAHWTKGERKSERRERECKAKKKYV